MKNRLSMLAIAAVLAAAGLVVAACGPSSSVYVGVAATPGPWGGYGGYGRPGYWGPPVVYGGARVCCMDAMLDVAGRELYALWEAQHDTSKKSAEVGEQ